MISSPFSTSIDSYMNAVARGNVVGATPIYGYGRKTTVGADSGVLWPNGAFVYPAAAGVQMSIVSDSANDTAAGTGIRTMAIHYLDADLAQQTEVVTLNGVTPVLTVATNIRFIQCMHMVTWGSGGMAAGNISASNGGNTHSYIASGSMRCTSSVRMCPAGKRMVVAAFFSGSSSGAAAASAMVNAASPQFEGYDFTTQNQLMPLGTASYQDGSAGIVLPVPYTFTEGQSFGFTFKVDKASTVSAQWFGWLEQAD